MNISRRRFMKAGILAAAFAGVPLEFAKSAIAQQSKSSRSTSAASGQLQSKNQPDLLFYYNKSTFTPYVNTEFRVHVNASKTITVTLVKVEDSPNSQEAPQAFGEECFSLQFSGPLKPAFGQNTYQVEHAALGKFSLFLVPVGMRAGGSVTYEAVFNRRNQFLAALPTPMRNDEKQNPEFRSQKPEEKKIRCLC